jgi:hypothetical protein
MVGEAGENRLRDRDQTWGVATQDQLDEDRRYQSDADGQKKIEIALLHCRAVPVHFRRDPIALCAPAMAGTHSEDDVRRLRCDRDIALASNSQ